MALKGGIIDEERNPFACESWIEQGYRFTGLRKKQVTKILGKSVDDIKCLDRDRCIFPAFVSIRWGFAKINDDLLIATERWHNKACYDKNGEPISHL